MVVNGKILKEVKVACQPDAVVAFLGEAGFSVARISLEAGRPSQRSYAGLIAAGLETVLLEFALKR
jgi:transposase